ncbi:NAD(P)-dependent malic enzyme [Neomoorella thermoacetica]|uniref:Malate dehydrogenase (Oxaloacetate decarboxylating) n=2 Tax=Neomoorella thermoacetica TaxID=1525 RepID=Q2RLF4_MOOTA|nr:NADP-dependent malic enzyme [Moorella thermoacetica]AKX93149.1 NAD-dependent malic enzyme [Moorella thermoacetica]AKX95791.1 NAD-dependent malic enzyme [Moorella thermoacetica]OIQ10604.1 NAD-dependent malic enzyme [Moorella thermoacetica]OIQ53136.1 NAD-dependent malic enzyme [Moorella thermoacetica]OIQ53876.1 NAD-dependent malic enzyme [Moorella thermoacetica]
MSIQERALNLHREWQGKIETRPRVQVRNADDLTMAYTPGVAEPCKEIHKDPNLVDVYTRRWNLVAVVSDGSAVLGLGNIGARAAMPVMEGKSVLFKSFAGVDAFPICIDSQDVDEIVRTVQLLTPTFGGVNLEDIAAPRCFEIERRLKETTDIPIFHDDQHGTAVVVLSAIINACKITKRELSDLKVVINGAGAAGIACGKLLVDVGVSDVILCDSKGIICSKRDDLNAIKKEMLQITNKEDRCGTLADAMEGANCFIGLSVKDAVTPEMVRSMDKDSILFAMANPVPEILPDVARAAGAAVVGTGRSDFPNQVNNVLGFPGIFRGALDVKASDINDAMKIAAAHALADLVGDRLSADFVMPEAFDPRVAPAVAMAVARAAIESGVARDPKDPEWVKRHTEELIARQ